MKKLSAYLATGLIALVGILPFAIVGLSVTGCSTVGQNGGTILTPARVKAVAYLGTAFALTAHPEYRTGFTIAVAELKFLETQDKIDFATFLAIVHKFPVKELEGQNGILYITAATLLLDDLGGSLDMSKIENLKPYVVALREGIELGLGTPPTVPPVPIIP